MSRVRSAVAGVGAALVVGSLSLGGTAMAADGDPVTFASDEFRDCVNAASVPAQPAGTTVTEGQAATVTAVDCQDGSFTDLAGVESLVNLETIDLSNGTATDLSVFTEANFPALTMVTAIGMYRELPDIPVGQQQANPLGFPRDNSPLDLLPWSPLGDAVVTFDAVHNWTFLTAHEPVSPTEGTLVWSSTGVGVGIQPHYLFSGTMTQRAIWLPPTVDTQPTFAGPVIVGSADIALTSTASSNQAPTVQWQQSVDGTTWEDIAGATDTTLTIPAADVVKDIDGLQIRAMFTNDAGSVPSDVVTLDIVEPAVFTVDPADQTIAAGGSVEFRAEFTSDAVDPQFAWEYSTDGGVTWQEADNAIPANQPATRAVTSQWFTTLSVSNVTADLDGALFRARIWDDYTPAITGTPARLTVTTSPTDPVPGPGTPTINANGSPIPAPSATSTTTPRAAALPRTGSDVWPIVGAAAALVALGAGTVLFIRRRRATTA